MGHGRICLAALQPVSRRLDKAGNLQRCEVLLRAAARSGAQVVLTPEVVTTGFVGGAAELPMAESIPGPTTDHFAGIAQELSIYVLLGLSEILEGQLHNSMVVIAPDGNVEGVMRKVHINRFETSGGWRNGSEFPVWTFRTTTGEMTAGIMICYDREVPESARLLMVQGVDLIFNPLACPCTAVDIHRCLLRTRAYENEVYLLVANPAAEEQSGHSMLIDYNGEIIAELSEKEDVLIAEIDLDMLNTYRESSIYGLHHRRPELYGALSDSSGQLHPDEANLP